MEEQRIKEWLNEDGTLLHNGLGLLLKRRIKEKRIEEWLNENECTTLIEGLYLLCNGLCLLLLYYNQMIIMPMNLLDCICLDTR